jgi:hypothetical protein
MHFQSAGTLDTGDQPESFFNGVVLAITLFYKSITGGPHKPDPHSNFDIHSTFLSYLVNESCVIHQAILVRFS